MAEVEEESFDFFLYAALPLSIFALFWFTCGSSYFARDPPRRPRSDPPPKRLDEKDYIYLTKEELWKYNGKHGQEKIYLAVKNEIFDVTKADFYHGDGPYKMFAGREVSIAMAKNSTEMKDVEADWKSTKLSASYQDSLDSWHGFFWSKYQMVGKVIESKKDQ